ncbi:P60-like protein [Rhizopogon vinicolor AM-OR11-026]|uniref:Ribosome biogenesis protein NOP53 n=1 Tax=Rhizopogon vinicolor AM-OR11-026 TaxID=1314800 RepID=A0A1B7MV55_9AGAM|nr:P60-like protein [Rhizopogon vinicolor AM-OR11-026]
MAPTKTSKISLSASKSAVQKPNLSDVGAPSQLAQSTRKGKRAWRKNIDILPVEQGLESLRSEERVIGSTLQKQTDDQLFVVDTKGDDRVRKALPRYSKAELTATKILAQRSAVPAVFSRPTAPSRSKVSKADKERLLRIAKRPRKGPFNAVMDHTEFGAGSAAIDVSAAVKHSGSYDPWVVEEVEDIADGLEHTRKPKIKAKLSHPRDIIEVPAVLEPHQGSSYNPPAAAHEELITEAFKVELRRQEEADRMAEVRRKVAEARTHAANATEGLPLGMTLDEIPHDDGEPAPEEDTVVPKKPSAPKTKQQRAKALRLRAEKQALVEKAAKKRMLTTIMLAKSLRSSAEKTSQQQHQARLARQLALRMKLSKGLAGQRLGKYKVPENEIEVQIGEDLSENLRTLKPEGNLFRDRFRSLQQRALVEPRVPVLSVKRARLKEYEKHAWKRFE